jgi:asparagine synthase (glutamine-hydrolysing)
MTTIPFVCHFRDHPPWSAHGGTHVRGTAFRGDEMLDAASLCRRFDACAGDAAKFRALLDALNGFFAVVHVRGDKLLAAVDIIRSIPLFYGEKDGQLFVGDDARWVRDAVGDSQRDPDAEREFLLVGYVTGRDTLYENVKQVRAGEMISAPHPGEDSALRSYYFRHKHGSYSSDGCEDLLRTHDDALLESFRRLAAYANGRKIVVPLSGGYDSRLIAFMLKRLDYRDVLCFTYGIQGNTESEISRSVAEALGFPWELVPYSVERWSAWFASEGRRRYSVFADGLCVVPIHRDWPAIEELVRRGLAPRDSVVCAGYAADLPAGSFSAAYPSLYVSKNLLSGHVLLRYVHCLYCLRRPSAGDAEFARERAGQVVPAGPHLDTADLFEEWFTLEKVAKFVVNAVRAYEHFDLDWWLPFFDRSFIGFWLSVPPPSRFGQALYRRHVDSIGLELGVSPLPSKKTGLGPMAKALVRDLVIGTPSWERRQLARRRRLGAAARRRAYRADPIALWGMVDDKTFAAGYTGIETVYSFLAERLLEELDHEASEK